MADSSEEGKPGGKERLPHVVPSPGKGRQKLSKAERAARLATVAEMYFAGKKQSDIAEAIGVSQARVSKVVLQMQEWMYQTSEKRLEIIKSRELRRIDYIEREYLDAWHRSKGSEEIVEEINAPQGMTTKFRSRGKVGDAAFLQGALDCVRERMKIVGGYAPVQIVHDYKTQLAQHGQDVASVFEWFVGAIVKQLPPPELTAGVIVDHKESVSVDDDDADDADTD